MWSITGERRNEKHPLDVSEEGSQKQYHKFKSPHSLVTIINVVIMEGDFVHENWSKINIFINNISEINPELMESFFYFDFLIFY